LVCSRVTLSKKPLQQKTALTSALVAPTPRGSLLSATDFDKSEWEIRDPLFVEEGLVDPCECVNRKDACCFIFVL
jgi:hypothetical protein